MCQGKMPLSVRERYEKMREQNNISLNIDKLINNFVYFFIWVYSIIT